MNECDAGKRSAGAERPVALYAKERGTDSAVPSDIGWRLRRRKSAGAANTKARKRQRLWWNAWHPERAQGSISQAAT
jgi:hypothetical protein